MGLPTEAGHLWLNAVLQDGSAAWMALLTADVTPASTGSTLAEPSGGGYARVQYDRTVANWPAAAGGQITNGVLVQFPAATAGWGVCTHWALVSAATAGTIVAAGRLVKGLNVVAGKAPRVGVGRAVVYAPFQVAA